MKILSFQPFSLYENGGGGRVLRRLYEGHESDITSLALISNNIIPQKGEINEIILLVFPVARKWMRWHLRHYATHLRENTFRDFNVNKVRQAASSIAYDVLHVVHHGPYADAFSDCTFLLNKALWVSFHDHFSTNGSSFETTQALWDNSARRLLISSELGNEYQRLFGPKEYELMTDGVTQAELSQPAQPDLGNIKIYFAGLLHIDYLPLFSVLADALDSLSLTGMSFTLILRGTQKVSCLENRLFITEYRSSFVSDAEIKKELDSADLLYMPIKFTSSDFYLYSLSTKMVNYLSGSGSILYHGPENSAACNLLRQYEAASCCNSLVKNEMIATIQAGLCNSYLTSQKAKILARTMFDIDAIRSKFWRNINSETLY